MRAALEFGPLAGFLIAYLILRDVIFTINGTDYTGFVAVTGAFVPVFILCTGALWALAGRIARLQVAAAGLLILFGGLSVWFNDPQFFKMKPTAIYLLLAVLLGIGLLRGEFWLKFILEDMVPLKEEGWRILTHRMLGLFVFSALANELVWRTQSEAFWVGFETIAMPIFVIAFFIAQLGVIVDHATWPPAKKKKAQARPKR
ncbi:MAG: septation protein IspZ [Pseudomonadota bacterium]